MKIKRHTTTRRDLDRKRRIDARRRLREALAREVGTCPACGAEAMRRNRTGGAYTCGNCGEKSGRA